MTEKTEKPALFETLRITTGVPEKHGFDVFFGYYDQVHAHSFYPPYLIARIEAYFSRDPAVKWQSDHGFFIGRYI